MYLCVCVYVWVCIYIYMHICIYINPPPPKNEDHKEIHATSTVSHRAFRFILHEMSASPIDPTRSCPEVCSI